MWESILVALSKVTLSRGARDDDGIDQLHHFGTVALLAAFATLIGMEQYVGDPIHCLTPANFPDQNEDYAENICWISKMYYIPMDEPLPFHKSDRKHFEFGFYRWVAAIFLFQCFLFKLPNIVWKELRGYAGINVQKIVNMADEVGAAPPEDREKMISDMTAFISHWLRYNRIYKYNVVVRMKEKMSSVFCFFLGKRHGTYLTGLYLFVKILNLVNIIGQFFLLTRFLEFNFWTYGIDVMKQFTNDKWIDDERFPRVVYCDFEYRQLSNVITQTIQCVLSINMFTEKMFALIWFWFALLAIATIINLVIWIYNIFFSKSREHFVEKYLMILGDRSSRSERQLFKNFVHNHLRDDGVFVLRSVSNNSSEIIVMDLIKELWIRYKESDMKKRDATAIKSAQKQAETNVDNGIDTVQKNGSFDDEIDTMQKSGSFNNGVDTVQSNGGVDHRLHTALMNDAGSGEIGATPSY